MVDTESTGTGTYSDVSVGLCSLQCGESVRLRIISLFYCLLYELKTIPVARNRILLLVSTGKCRQTNK